MNGQTTTRSSLAQSLTSLPPITDAIAPLATPVPLDRPRAGRPLSA
jgi:hypothetical protein